jgi:hypothetical protein
MQEATAKVLLLAIGRMTSGDVLQIMDDRAQWETPTIDVHLTLAAMGKCAITRGVTPQKVTR